MTRLPLLFVLAVILAAAAPRPAPVIPTASIAGTGESDRGRTGAPPDPAFVPAAGSADVRPAGAPFSAGGRDPRHMARDVPPVASTPAIILTGIASWHDTGRDGTGTPSRPVPASRPPARQCGGGVVASPDSADPLAARPHHHKNGGHIHPHGHDGYEPVPSVEARRPIIAANGWPQPGDLNAQ